MEIIVSYFDKMIGPTIGISIPQNINKEKANILRSLLDINTRNNAFEFTPSGNDNIKYLNLIFEIPSSWARGDVELIMLSVTFTNRLAKPIIEHRLNRLKEIILSRKSIFKAFYMNENKNDDVITEYNALRNLITNEYNSLNLKIENLKFVDNLFEEKSITYSTPTTSVLQTVARAFITCIDARVPEGAFLLFEIGEILANKFETVFSSIEIDLLLNEIAKFWKRNEFGEIDDVVFTEDEGVYFNVYDCFECKHMDNVNQTVCRFDEGFLTNLLEIKTEQKFNVTELECYASGFDHCRFNVRKVA